MYQANKPTPLFTSRGRVRPSVLRPVVLHAVREYLPLTENWIYEQIRQASGFFPVVVCDQKSNDRAFPLGDVFANSELRFARAHHLLNQLHRKVLYANWPGSYGGVVSTYQPRLIHAHFGDRGVLMLGTAKRHKIPLVTTFYGYDVSKMPLEAKWQPRLRWLFEEGDMFLAEGPAMRRRLIALGCPEEKAHVHHLGVDPRRILFSPRQAPAAGPMRVLMAASFREKKGLIYGLEAFARLAQRRRGQVQLTIIGDGPLKEELRALASEMKVMPFIRWLGYQPHDVFLREASACHLFMAPSVVASDGDTEGGAPVSIIEAQATGLPVLATTHADIPEVTLPGVSAFLVPERDVDALEERLEYMLDHPEIWAAMGMAGRAHVQKEFDSFNQGKRLEALYRQIMR
ncbi:MAG: putative colanic acid biosynthesis glycosyl transferase [Cyanobacteria bacterium RYN_339]|nr:putative colanic acid biosynthesis glycosyl transferase [Cyanobacteria bacterium RYN_339]